MAFSQILPWLTLLSLLAFVAWWIFKPGARSRKTDFRVITASTFLMLISGAFVFWQSGFQVMESTSSGLNDITEWEWNNDEFQACWSAPEPPPLGLPNCVDFCQTWNPNSSDNEYPWGAQEAFDNCMLNSLWHYADWEFNCKRCAELKCRALRVDCKNAHSKRLWWVPDGCDEGWTLCLNEIQCEAIVGSFENGIEVFCHSKVSEWAGYCDCTNVIAEQP